MSTNRYVVAPREPTWQMVNAFIVATDAPFACRDGYKAMLAAIPDDPSAPVLVERSELEALREQRMPHALRVVLQRFSEKRIGTQEWSMTALRLHDMLNAKERGE